MSKVRAKKVEVDLSSVSYLDNGIKDKKGTYTPTAKRSMDDVKRASSHELIKQLIKFEDDNPMSRLVKKPKKKKNKVFTI